MAARATWKGFLKISLVNIPIKVFPATESSGTISFNQLHGECQTRIQQKRWCPHCNREVPNSEIVKGYEFEKGRYVVLSEEDFDKVRPESTRVIDLVQFADDSAIDPMYVDRAYYLAPDGKMAARRVRGDARRHEGQGRHRQAGAVRPRVPRRRAAARARHRDVHAASRGRDPQHRHRRGAELRAATVKPEEMKLAKQVIGTFEGAARIWPTTRTNTARGCSAIIDAKIAGEEIVAPAVEAPPKVVNLMEALKKSLDAVSATKKKPAKAAALETRGRETQARLTVPPALSFVITVDNGAETIEPLVRSIEALVIDGGHEIVLINDGSRDATVAVCRHLCETLAYRSRSSTMPAISASTTLS